MGATFMLVAAMALVTAVSVPTAVPAAAAPGSPGTPGDAPVVYSEDFQNRAAPTPIVRLPDYTGAGDQQYTADQAWLQDCNGWIAAANQPVDAADQVADCGDDQATWNRTQQLAQALGVLNGSSTEDAASNYAVSAFTTGSPGAGAVEIQTTDNVPFSASNRFVTFGVDVAAMSCGSEHPLLQFALLDDGGDAEPVGTPIDGCASDSTVDMPAIGDAPAAAVNVGHYTSDGAVLFSGDSVGVRMVNNQASGAGNDHAFDNIQILDVTPQLDKAFAPTEVNVGGISTLTMTVTNTSELAAKDGWGFTDTLADGLVIAANPNVGGDCVADVTADAGASSIAVTDGNLPAGTEACTISVDVTSATAATYANGPDNISGAVGIDLPGDSSVTFVVPEAWQCDAFGYLFQSPDAQAGAHTITQVDLATGANSVIGNTADYVNAVGYNPTDNYFYAWNVAVQTIVRIAGDYSLTDLGVPAGLPLNFYLTGDFDDAGHYWILTNQSPAVWAEIDYAAGSATYGEVLQQGAIPDDATFPSDWSYIDGSLYGLRPVDGAAHLFAFDTANPAAGTVDLGLLDGPTDATVVGATYTDGTYLYASNNPTGAIYRVNPTNLQTILAANGPSSSGNDGARCAAAPIPTITVIKDVVGRASAADQFTVGLDNSGGDTLTSATTVGTETSASTTNWPVSQGGTYTVTDAMAAGSPNDIGRYMASIACVDGAGEPVTTGGTELAWTLTIADATDYTCTVTNDLRNVDFGDAPDSYGTTVGADGPRHNIPGLDVDANTAPVMLGSAIDSDNDGQPTAGADGDDTTGAADEDGVVFNPDLGYDIPTLRSGVVADTRLPVENTLDVTASADGFVSVWVDWNVDGDFDDDGEQVAAAQAVTAGTNAVTFEREENPPSINTYVRVRYSTVADAIASPVGEAPDGEVEDYRVQVERLIVPASCTVSDVNYYAFTYTSVSGGSGAGGPGTSVRFTDVSVVDGQPVDMLVEVLSGNTYSIRVGEGGIFETDDANWQINTDVSLRYTFVAAGTTTPVPVNGAFTVNDMDATAIGDEIATFTTADVAGYAVTEGSLVSVSQDGPSTLFTGDGDNNGDPVSRFQISLEGISTFDARWQGFTNSGFGFDGDADLAIEPTCSDFGDAPDSYGTTLAVDGARTTILPGLTLGSTIDLDPDGQPNAAADGDDTNRVADEDGVADPIAVRAGTESTVTVSVSNDTDDPATLAGWIDLDGNGTFDAGERQTISVPANSGMAEYALSWPGQTVPAEATYARFRLYTGEVADPAPTGAAEGGEVEDYLVQTRVLDIEKTSNATEAIRQGDTVTYMVTATNTGTTDFTADDPAQVIDDLTGVLDDASFDGAVTVDGSDVAAGYSEPRISWSGALAAGDSVTLTYTVTLNRNGDHVVQNVAFQPPLCTEDDCPTPPTPDHDACVGNGVDPDTGLPCDGTSLPLPRLTVDKTSPDLGTAQIGDTVQYTITATNTGAADYTVDGPAQMVDDLSAVLDDGTYAGDAAIVDDGPGGVTYAEPQITWTGALAVGESVSVTYSVTLGAGGDQTVDNIVFENPVCTVGDCPPPTPPSAEDCVTNDGIDPATGLSCVPVNGGLPKLKLDKVAPDLAEARIGDTVTWTVTATNVGQRAFPDEAPATIVDDLTGVLDDASFDGSVTVEGSDIEAVYTAPQIGWSGPLGVGDTVTVTYSLVITGAGDGQVDNVTWQLPPVDPGCELGDCPPVDAADCEANNGIDPASGLPCDSTEKPLPRPELDKSSPDAATAHVGDTVSYTVTFTNRGPGDYTAARPALVADDLSGVLDDATFDGQVTVAGSDIPATVDGSVIAWSGPVAAGESVTLTYRLTVTGAGDKNLENLAWVPPAPPVCEVDDCPPPNVPPPPSAEDCATNDGIDPATGLPCAFVDDPLPVLELTKSSAELADAAIGDTVTYTVTATNIGGRDFTADDPAQVIDDLAGVLDDATFDGQVAVDGSDVAAAYSEPRITWSGGLAVGDTVTLSYRVTLTGAGDMSVLNVAFVPPLCTTDDCPPPPTPPTADCLAGNGIDPATGLPCVPVLQNLRQLTIAKSSDAAAVVKVGDTVTYTVTATNTGQEDYTTDSPAVVVDDLAGVLDDATYNGDAAADREGTVGYAEPQLSWTGALAAGESVTITYTVQVTAAGDLDLLNVAFTPPSGEGDCAADGTCPPPDPQDCLDNDGIDPTTGLPCAEVRDPLPALYVEKSVDRTEAVAGDVLSYTITLTNTGKADFTDDNPARLTDDLTDVLDDATYNGDARVASGQGNVSDSELSWSGPLPVDESVTITYSVTVKDGGDGNVYNVVAFDDGVTPRYPGGVCPDGAAECDPPTRTADAVSGIGSQPADPVAPGTPPTGGINSGNGTLGADTGVNAALIAGITMLVLLAGAGAYLLSRRRQQD